MRAHDHDLRAFEHSHAFADAGQRQRERALTGVTLLTLVTMVLEVAVGWWSGSLALTADGWHMGTHALALGGAVLAYRLSQRAATRRAGADGTRAGFAFGGWKIEVLAAYTSGLALLVVAGWLGWEGVQTLRQPHPVAYGEALVVAVIGLLVNLASVWMLARGARPASVPAAPAHGHAAPTASAAQPAAHDHAAHGRSAAASHGHAHGHSHHDHNFSAAYLHVLADAFTSVLAIAALAGGYWYGWAWLDPAVALLGAAVIAQWAFGVLRNSARALVDATEDPELTQRVRATIESDGDAKVADLHVWQVGAQAWSAAVAVVADAPLAAAVYRQRLAGIDVLRHVTVEVHRCPGGDDATEPG